MADSIDDGGNAFPLAATEDSFDYHGMTLRDYFAGQALSNFAESYGGNAFDPRGRAKSAYEFADAMIEARK